jgi:hypothetical protein
MPRIAAPRLPARPSLRPAAALAALALALALPAAGALAQDEDDPEADAAWASLQPDGSRRACLLEGSGTVMGQPFAARDCVEAVGMPEPLFRQQCEGMANAAVAMGGPAASITWSETCPSGEQARCITPSPMPGLSIAYVYYARDPELLASSREGCALMGGTWR